MDSRTAFSDSNDISNGSSICHLASNNTEIIISSEVSASDPDIVALRHFSDNIESIFGSSDFDYFTDAKIALDGGREVGVHRCILSARSSYFKAAFAALRESGEKGGGERGGVVKLQLKELAKEFQVGFDSLVAVLAYLYSGKVKPLPASVCVCADEECTHISCRPVVEFLVEVLYLCFTFQISELFALYQVSSPLAVLIMNEESVSNVSDHVSTEADKEDSKGKSDAKLDSAAKVVVAVPRYLRASTGSCHDACKYGKQHTFESKTRRPAIRKSAPIANRDIPVEILVPADRNKKKVEKTTNHEHPPVMPTAATKTIEQKKSPSPVTSPSPDAMKSMKKKKQFPSPKKPSSLVDSKPSHQTHSKSPSSLASTSTKRRIPSSAEKKSSIKPVSSDVKQRIIIPSKSSASSSKLQTAAVKPATSRDSLWAATGRINGGDNKTGGNTRTSRVAGKIKSVPVTMPSSLANNERVFKTTPRKGFVPPTKVMPSSKSSGSKLANSNRGKTISSKEEDYKAEAAKNLKQDEKVDHKSLDDEMVQEKTLHVIEPVTDCKSQSPCVNHPIQSASPLSPASLQSVSQPTSHSFSSFEADGQCRSGYTDTEDEGSVSNYDEAVEESGDVKDDSTRSSRTVRPSCSKQENHAPLKLKFRNGKVVELESDTNIARKLRFRRGKVLADNLGSNGDAGWRSFRKRAVIDANVTKSATVKVVLRHQDVQGKKDNQVLLFNSMIEETASKLVETRKSKVKALVGAFETVISLQEGKLRPDQSTDVSF